jgi:hypothetical protein
MHNFMKRLERLEQAAPRELEPLRMIREIVATDNGRALPWSPRWAQARFHDSPEAIFRGEVESIEDFEKRAGGHFSGHFVIGGGDSQRKGE